MGDVAVAAPHHVGRVDEIDWHVLPRVGNESCGGIDVERRADHHEDVGFLHGLGGRLYHRDGLAEEHDERAQETSVARLGTFLHLAVLL